MVFSPTSAVSGTGNNLAIMPLANQEKIPQIYLQSGSTAFSNNQKANPWTIGWLPTYHSEGESFGKFLAAANKPLTVGVLAQNDDVGDDYVSGFEAGIKGSQVKIVEKTTYAPTDPTVDAQITKLAGTKADVFYSANVQVPLAVASLLKAQQLGWLPAVFLPSNTSAKTTILDPGHGEAYPAVYTTASAKNQNDPKFAGDADVKKFVEDMKQYASGVTTNDRLRAMRMGLWHRRHPRRDIQGHEGTHPGRPDGLRLRTSVRKFEAPMLLPGITVDTSSRTTAPVDAAQVQKFSGTAYANASHSDG